MTYEQLLDELNDMTEKQLKQTLCVCVNGEWILPEVVAVVKVDYSAGEEGSPERFDKFQTILI